MKKDVERLMFDLTRFTRRTGLVLSVSIHSEYANLVLKKEWESCNDNYRYEVTDDRYGEYVFKWQASSNKNSEVDDFYDEFL